MYKLFILLSLCAIFPSKVYTSLTMNANLTQFMHHRQKRTLTFANSGVLKLVIGPIFPLDLGDPVPWRSFVCLYNLQGGHYSLPTTPLYPWDKWEDEFARSMEKQSKFKYEPKVETDDSRFIAYQAMEAFITRQGSNGPICLLRLICENAQIDHHIGIFAELMDVLLTPGKENISETYSIAYEMGKYGVDCYQTFPECPRGATFLDNYLDTF